MATHAIRRQVHRQAQQHTGPAPLPTEQFRVYEATDPFHPAPFRLALRRSREAVLLADMESGRKLLRLGRLVLQTTDEARARRMAQALYL